MTAQFKFPLLHLREIEPPKAARYLVKGLLPHQGLTVIWGPPKNGKSFWALDLALHVALGMDFRGHRTKQGTVVYVACEGEWGFGARVDAALKNLSVEVRDAPFFLLPSRIDLINDHDRLVHEIKSQGVKPSLVVIDTLNRSFSGSESSDTDMSQYIRAADRVGAAFNCCVAVVHHCGHSKDRPRGHSSLIGATDCQIAIKMYDGAVVAEVELMKDGEAGEKTSDVLKTVSVGIDEEGDEITSCALGTFSLADILNEVRAKPKSTTTDSMVVTKLIETLKAALSEYGIKPTDTMQCPTGIDRVVSIETWRKLAYAASISEGDERARQQAFKRGKDKLIEAKRIGVVEPNAFLISNK